MLAHAEQGLAAVHAHWWDSEASWYDDVEGSTAFMPLARLWSAFPVFEATDAVAIADPSASHLAAVRSFVAGAERYWNPAMQGYAYYPGATGNDKLTFFDDNGWWALAFLDAYRATHDHRDIVDAARAFRFIDARGWDGNGVWWDTRHHKKTSEPLAAEILAGALLYRDTHSPGYLRVSLRLLRWANAHSWNASRGLYQRNADDPTVMDYVEGMMAAALGELCKATGNHAYCTKAEQVGQASLASFGRSLNWGPQYDVVYLRWMLDLYTLDHNATWWQLAVQNAQTALAHAADANGLWTLGWDGAPATSHQGEPNMVEFQAATTSLFAWLAVVKQP